MLIRSFRQATAGLPRTFWYVWAGMLVNRMGTFVVPFLALYLTDHRHYSKSDAGIVISLFGLGALLASPTGGLLADRLGRRATMLLGMVSASAAVVALAFSDEPGWIALNTFLLGFTSELYRPAVSAYVADVVAPEHRVRAFGAMYWAANLGFAVALSLAGFVGSKSYFALFIADGITTLTFAIIVALKLPETKPAAPPVPVTASSPGAALAVAAPRRTWTPSFDRLWRASGYAEVIRDGVFMSFAGLTFLLAMLFFQHNSTLMLGMKERGIPVELIGTIVAINGVLIVALQPFATAWVKRLRRSHAMAAAALLVGLGFGMNAWAHAPWMFAAGVVVWTLGEIMNSPVAAAVVADLAPTHARGRYQGVHFMAWSLAFFAGPALGAWVMDRFGAPTLWIGCFAVGGVIALGHLLIAAPRRKRMAALREQGMLGAAPAIE